MQKAEAGQRVFAQRLPAVEVATVAGLILFIELALIRYVAAYVRVFGFYVNFVVIATFLGMGTGMLRRRNVDGLLWIGVPTVLVAFGLVAFLAVVPIHVPTHDSEYIWGYVSADVEARHVSISTAVIILFVTVTLLFVPLGALLGDLFSKLRPLDAYSFDLVGSLIGVGAFAAMSFLQTEPTTWFAIAFMVWLALLWRRRPLVFAMGAAAAMALAVIHWTRESESEYWSPYYRITLKPTNVAGIVEVYVNGALHQDMVDFARADRYAMTRTIRMAYERPYRIVRRIDTALVVGAGTGNDIAVLLSLGARHIDAVEIDPVIASIGQVAHPQHPYDDPRVHLVVTDARAFLRAPPRKYDVITFGTLDSQSLLSGMSAVRLDNFVYTEESFRAARAALQPGGSIVLYHLSGYEHIGARLYQLLNRQFEAQTRVIKENDYLFNHTIIAGGGAAGADTIATAPGLDARVELTTDDWPFPYLLERGLPRHYVAALLAVLLVGACFVGIAAGASALRVPNWSMFLIGVGFLLLETKGITAMSLLFGSTWIVNLAVIASILCVALAGAQLTARNRAPRVGTCLAALTVLLALSAFLPASGLVTAAPGLRWVVAAAYVGLPVLFATMIFSQSFASAESPTSALAFNTLGGVAGGVLEYSSMMVGIKALNWLAIGAYSLAVALGALKARRGVSVAE